MKKNVLIVGTGTIGEPLIGLFADLKEELDLGAIFFHKRTPLLDERAKVNSLIKRGAKLVVDRDQIEKFQQLGHEASLHFEAALSIADVVIDCTPAGNKNKEQYYEPALAARFCGMKDKQKTFIAQGSEKGFGFPYAHGINDEALKKEKPNFIQVVSCNSHNIACLIKSLSPSLNDVVSADFVCIRRANDISQESGFVASPQVNKHSDNNFGTHHAKDVYDLLSTLNKNINIYSSAMKLNSQYMHCIRFNVLLKGGLTKTQVLDRFKENKFVALTQKTLANRVFSFGRDHGFYGRFFNQTIISEPTLTTVSHGGTTQVTGFCFTPQDGNSLLSSVAATMFAVHEKTTFEHMNLFESYLYDEV